jgi:hypothetical protein
MINVCKILDRKHEERTWETRRKREDNIKMPLREIPHGLE